jgi:glutamate N-acetyltransferase/amino-acid N-acetyltransferase
VVRDGEGARKLITITVAGAVTNDSARQVAFSIANSPLVKTAIAGGDANWGRLAMAIGKAGEPIEPKRIAIRVGGHAIAEAGHRLESYDEAPVSAHLKGQEILLEVTIGGGPGAATVWTCDLTHDYITINAHYRS